MKIIQITASPLPDCYKNTATVYGLGDDNKIYFWNWKEVKWQLEAEAE